MFYESFLTEYHKTPAEVDSMSCNDVYMILYAQKVREINKRFADAKKTNAAPASSDILKRLGS